MKKIITLSLSLFAFILSHAQTFTRTPLATKLITPWEITYGPDNYLWVTDSGGVVLKSGIYILKLTTPEGGIITGKFIKQ
jgi:hypothetical protein